MLATPITIYFGAPPHLVLVGIELANLSTNYDLFNAISNQLGINIIDLEPIIQCGRITERIDNDKVWVEEPLIEIEPNLMAIDEEVRNIISSGDGFITNVD